MLALADLVFGPQKAGDIALLTFLLDYLRENADTALVKGQTLEVLSEAFKKNQFPTIKGPSTTPLWLIPLQSCFVRFVCKLRSCIHLTNT